MPLAQRNDPNIDVNMDINEPLNKIGKLGREMKGLGRIFENFENQVRASDDVDFKKTIKGASELQKEAKKTASTFTTLKGTISTFAGNILADAAQKFGELGVELVKTGVEAAATRVGLISLYDSLEVGARQYEKFIEIAQQFGVASGPIIQVASSLKVANVEGEELEKTIRSLTTAARGNSEAFKSIGLAYNQIISDKVTAENLLQIAEQGVQIWGALADRVGVARNEIRDYVSQGKVSVEQFKLAFDDLAGDESKLREAVELTAGTIQAQITNLKTQVSEFSREVVGLFEDEISGAITFASGKLDEFLEGLDDISQRLASRRIAEAAGIDDSGGGFGKFLIDLTESVSNFYDKILSRRQAFGANIAELEGDLNEFYSERETILGKIEILEKSSGLLANSQLSYQRSQLKALEEKIKNGETLLGQLKLEEGYYNRFVDGAITLALHRQAAAEKESEISVNILAIRENIAKVEREAQVEIDVVNKKRELGLLNEEQLQEQINKINEEKLNKLIEIESEIKKLTKGTEDWKNLSQDVETLQQKIADNLNSQKTFSELNLDTYEKRKEFNAEHRQFLDHWVYTLPKATAELKKQEAAEKARNDLLRERLGLQDGEFITAEDRVKDTGGGSGENLGDILEEEANEELERFNSTVEEIVHNLDLVHDGFTSIADIINSAGVRELQAMNQELDNLRLRNKKIEEESNRRHELRLKIIDKELQAEKISQEEADAKREESAELEKAEINALRNAEIKKENDINQKSYELALQNYEFTKRLRQAEIAINGTAAALSAAASNKWVEFALIVFGGLAGLIGAEATPPPAKPAPIPYLAEGGILTSPTLFMGGEEGIEAVMPLDRLNEFINMRGENGPNFVFNIDGIIDQGNLIYTIQKAIKDGY